MSDCTPTKTIVPPTAHGRRNYVLGVVNGSLGRLGMRLIDPHLVLTAFVYEVTRSPALVGLLSALTFAGALWPQLYMSSIMEHASRKKPYYAGVMVIRVAMLICMTAAMWVSGSTGSGWWMAVFFVAWFFLRSAQGAGAMPFLDMVGKTIHSESLGSFFAMRSLFGEILALTAGFLVAQPIIEGLDVPSSYVLLAVLGTVAMTCGWGTWTLTHEQASEDPPERRNVRQMLGAGMRLLRRDGNYRGLFTVRALMRINVLTLVFYVPYGMERLGTLGLAGVFVGCIAASRLLASPLWARVSRRQGNRMVLVLVGAFFAVSPLCALVAPRLPEAFSASLPWVGARVDLPMCVYLLALGLVGVALSGNIVGTNAFMLQSAPRRRRASYMAFLNTVTFPLAFTSMLAGLGLSFLGRLRLPLMLLGTRYPALGFAPRILGMELLLGLCVLTGLATLVATTRLREVRGEAD